VRLLVVDDEPLARRRLVRMLGAFPEVVVAAEAGSGLEALQLVRDLAPLDGLLLDVRMHDLDGIALARANVSLPPIVFVTAYDEFAVNAFEVRAVDYLVKPVRAERLAEAIARLTARRESRGPADATDTLSALAARRPESAARIVCVHRGVVKFFDAREISRFYAEDKYTIFRIDGEEHLTQESLDSLEERLTALGFVRVHRAELVDLSKISRIDAAEGSTTVCLRDGQSARVSRRMVAPLKAKLGV